MRGELKALYLGLCQLGDDEAVIVAESLKVNDIVEEVRLYSNMIGPRGAKAIADAVKHNKTVWRLYLGYNQIGDEGADFLINALRHNVCITELLVFSNNIAPEPMATIEFLTKTRNAVLIPAAARRASLYLISARRSIADAGILAIFPKEIVKMITMAVYATRKDPAWIKAVEKQ